MERDINIWNKLPASLQTRVAVVKMNILPRINFVSMMIPLPPPAEYWKKVDKLIRGYIWGGKHPKIRYATLQRPKAEGGLALPNFKLYHQSFQLRAIRTWLTGGDDVAWREVEETIVAPIKLEEIVYSGISAKQCRLRFGPIVSYSVDNFKLVEKSLGGNWKWHVNTPLWGNPNIRRGGRPFESAGWAERGVQYLGDVFDPGGLSKFEDLCRMYELPKTSFFLYLQLRSALRAGGVPLGAELQTHPIESLVSTPSTRGMVSIIYSQLQLQSQRDMPLV